MTKIIRELTWPAQLVDLSDNIWELIECPECYGDGWVYSFENGEAEKVECIECEGSGLLAVTKYAVELPAAS